MMVPREFAVHFHELDLLAVQRRDRLRPPMLAEQSEFLVQADLVHGDGLILSFILSYGNIVRARTRR